MPLPPGDIPRLVVGRGSVCVEALGNVCEEAEVAARGWVGEGGGCGGLGEGRGAGGMCLWHFDGCMLCRD